MACATQTQFRRGTAAANATFTGVEGEVTYATDTHRLYTHDGVAVGGFAMALFSDIPTSTTGLPEGTNLYYTDARVRAALSVSSPLTYNAGTGAFAITLADSTHGGYLSAADWVTFNAKQSAVAPGANKDVIFNDGGAFGVASAGFSLTFDTTNGLFEVQNTVLMTFVQASADGTLSISNTNGAWTFNDQADLTNNSGSTNIFQNGDAFFGANVTVGGGGSILQQDGTIYWGNSASVLLANGDIQINGGAIEISDTGSIVWATGASSLFANGAIQVNGGAWNLNADGSGDWGSVTSQFGADGSISLGGGQWHFTTDGGFVSLAGLTFDASIPQLSLNGGFFTVDTTDGLQLNSVHALSPDGTASFATGAFTIQPDGSTAIGGSVNIGGGVITLDPSDGSISSGPGIFSLNGTTGVLELASGWHWEPNGTGTWGAGAAAFGAGTISKYNGNTTAGNGVASIVGSFNNTATNANIASTTLFTPASTGLFEVSVVQLVTTAGTAGTLSTTIAWTDEVGATTATPAAGLTVATTGRDSGIIVISATAGNAISFSSSLSGLVGTTTYRVKVAVKRLQ